MSKYYYCPCFYIDSYYRLDIWVDNIKYYIQRIKKYNKVFNSYQDMLNYIVKEESVSEEDILKLDFTNNPVSIAYGLGVIHKADKRYEAKPNNLNMILSPQLGFILIEYN